MVARTTRTAGTTRTAATAAATGAAATEAAATAATTGAAGWDATYHDGEPHSAVPNLWVRQSGATDRATPDPRAAPIAGQWASMGSCHKDLEDASGDG